MSTTRQHLGAAGEREAEDFLNQRGLTLVERNYRCRSGEIDLVMLDSSDDSVDVLVFVEVRLRGRGAHADSLDSVDQGKQRKLITAARHYLMSRPEWSEHPCRFDVLGLDPDAQGLRWVRHAFETTD
ncbi:MAG: YraN family protein [Wenzhouxiangella sp.]